MVRLHDNKPARGCPHEALRHSARPQSAPRARLSRREGHRHPEGDHRSRQDGAGSRRATRPSIRASARRLSNSTTVRSSANPLPLPLHRGAAPRADPSRPHAEEIGEIETWSRRMELNLLSTIASAFRHLHPAMAAMEVPQVKEWGEVNKGRIVDELAFLDPPRGAPLHPLRPLHQCRHHRDDRHRFPQADALFLLFRRLRRPEALACRHGGAAERGGVIDTGAWRA